MTSERADQPERRELVLLAALVAGAAVLRFSTLSSQSFWLDETFTSAGVGGSLGDVLAHVRDVEVTPPLYFYAAWVWMQVFGDSDAALRGLSAVSGTATVAVAYLLGRAWIGGRAGVAAAALAAASPFLVWYSQEARAYALALLLVTASLVFLRRAADARPRALWGWGVTAALSAWTHYFTAFLIIPSALFLLLRRRPDALPALAASAAACLPLVVLVRHQTGDYRSAWIDEIELGERLTRSVRAFVSAPPGAPGRFLGLAAGALLLAGLLAAVWRRWPPSRQPLPAIVAAAVGIPLALALFGVDYVHYRNFIFVWPAVAAVAAAGLLAAGPRLGIALLAALVACFLAINVGIARDEGHQREDWEALAAALPPARDARLVMTLPRYADAPLRHYGHDLAPLAPTEGALAWEVAVAGRFALPPAELARRLGGGFAVALDETYGGGLRLVLLRAQAARRLAPRTLRGAPPGSLWLERAG